MGACFVAQRRYTTFDHGCATRNPLVTRVSRPPPLPPPHPPLPHDPFPPTQTADFCLVPMGTADPSVSKYIAECQRVLQKSGLKFEVNGTGVEGEYSAVMKVIEECHEAVHAMGCPRVATGVPVFLHSHIRIGTRVDKQGSLQAKIDSVKELLSKDQSTGTKQ
ncbi:hypothetical protein NBRC10512_001479 [Rhodotorula toruloides]